MIQAIIDRGATPASAKSAAASPEWNLQTHPGSSGRFPLAPGTAVAYVALRMNENNSIPAVPETQPNALKKKLRALQWQPEAIMRETVLIQRLREMALTEAEEQ